MASLQDLVDAMNRVETAVKSGGGPGQAAPMNAAPQRDFAAALNKFTQRFQETTASPQGALRQTAGLLGGSAGMAGAGFSSAAYQALTQAASKAATALDIVGNKALSTAQRNEELAKAFIPGMEAMLRFRDALQGVNEALRSNAEWWARMTQEQGRSTRLGQQEGAAGAAIASVQSRADALGAVKPAIPASIDRSTWQGELAYSIQQRKLPLQDDAARAQAEAKAARGAFGASKDRLSELKEKAGHLAENLKEKKSWLDKARGFESAFGGTGIRVKSTVDMAAKATDVAAGAFTANQKAIEEEINRQKELGVSLAEKESAARKANIAIAKEDLAIQREKVQALQSQGQRLGRMNPLERQMGLQAARLVKKQGVNNLPPELLAQAERFAPEYMKKEFEKAGLASDENRLGAEEGFLRKGNLKEEMVKLDKMDANVRVEIALDHAALAKEIAAQVSGLTKQLLLEVKAELAAERIKDVAGRIMAKNAMK